MKVMRVTIVMMIISIIVNSLAHVFLKFNVSTTSSWAKINLSPIRFFHLSPFFAIALLCFATSLVSYSKVLERLNLNFAFPVMNTCVYLVVGTLSFLLFKEKYTALQGAGFVITLVGLTLFAWR
jgi:multidrug transporter EmrE-like cation transporter